MAAVLHQSRIMPIDTLFSLSSSPPVSFYMNNAASAYLFHQKGLQAQDSSLYASSPPSFTSMTGLSLHDVNCLSNGMFTKSIKPPYNSNNSSSQRTVPNKRLSIDQPLRSCLRVKEVPVSNGIENGLSDCSETSTGTSNTTTDTWALEEQIERIQITEHSSSSSSSPSNSPKMKKKRVVFADDKGFLLVNIKYLEESPDIPPLLSRELLRHITQDAKPEPHHPFNYVLDFEQPASSYLEFRERIEHNCVSLENVMILDNIKVQGTIKVKNIAYEKKVSLRVTFDEWRTSDSVPATFVPQDNVSTSRYDTFAFGFDIPPNQGGKEFQFCIHYETPEGSFWDNNKEINYRITSHERKAIHKNDQQSMSSYYLTTDNRNNANFSYWKVAEDDSPYW